MGSRRQHDVTRIRRYLVTMLNAADDLLADDGRRFAPFLPFNGEGMALLRDALVGEAGPVYDPRQEELVASNSVGCVNPHEANGWYEHSYPGARYFSFPGAGHRRPDAEKDAACRAEEPGGSCASPDGSARMAPMKQTRIHKR